jgi:O-methyltransferase
VEAVKKQLGDMVNYVIHQGIFPTTASAVEDALFSLVHIDVDIYRSVLDCCQFFYPRVVSSGLLVFDDYGSESCPGAKMAVDEFFRDKPETPMYLPTGQCLVVKKAAADT